jgi:hypothetical protein
MYFIIFALTTGIVALPEEPVLRVQRKPVLKNEYKEPNIMCE